MTDKKPELTNEILMADVMLRITAMEKLLIEKGVFTQEELNNITEEIAKRVYKVILEKAQVSKNLDKFVVDLEASVKDKKGTPSN